MRITFAFRRFADEKVNAHLAKHFLLDQALIEATLVFDDSTIKVFKPSRAADGTFTLDLAAADIPDTAGAGPAHKKTLRRLSMDFIVDFTHGKTFRLLRIRQDFSLTALPANTDSNIEYELSPSSWMHAGKADKLTVNRNTHPLIDLSRLKENVILLNALVVDLTELWEHFHLDNRFYRLYRDLTDDKRVTFKVFAHLGGNSFLWYSIVPTYLAQTDKVSPHVFFSPSDYAPTQNIRDEQDYLLDNWKEFKAEEGSNDSWNGEWLLLGYLVPPVDDDRISKLKPRLTPPRKFDYAIRRLRNVVNFNRTKPKSSKFRTVHWYIPAGFQKAFYGLGDVKPKQFLLMPQYIDEPDDEKRGIERKPAKGSERGPHLTNVTNAILGLLQTNTDLISTGRRNELVEKDKMVLSSYSESGVDMWLASNVHQDDIKAIIGIEPNSVNPRGRNIIPTLLSKKIKVFIIGRHRGPKKGEPWPHHYRPDISEKLQGEIHFFPDKRAIPANAPKRLNFPLAMLRYPPDPDSNPFVKFRVARVTDKDLDPLLLDHEKEILEELGKRKKPVTGKAVIPLIFTPLGNSDRNRDGELQDIFYTHHFALTGGQEMSFADPDHFYGKDVTYRTFFQQAVEEIG